MTWKKLILLTVLPFVLASLLFAVVFAITPPRHVLLMSACLKELPPETCHFYLIDLQRQERQNSTRS